MRIFSKELIQIYGLLNHKFDIIYGLVYHINMNFKRIQNIEKSIAPKRALIVYGPRRVGKTTMLQSYLDNLKTKKKRSRIFSSTGDDFTLRELFRAERRKEILDFANDFDLIAIDEAQSIPSIGLGTKMIIDAFPEKIIILTGSSSFDLSNKIGEPLTGRHFTLTLFPVSQKEIEFGNFEIKNHLPDFLIFGSYPEVLLEKNKQKKIKILTEIVSSYLFKDVLALNKIRSSDLLLDIVKCLAFQIGSEVSLNEISKMVGTDVKTVGRYLDLLEKMFIIKKVRGFSRNLRNEISKKAKYYFIDNGVRNAVIGQFNELNMRNDIGPLWENFIFMEMIKQSNINDSLDMYYFWRTHTGQEIDVIKESGGKLFAYEIKWGKSKGKIPKDFITTYNNSEFQTINKDNYLEFINEK